jgi:hypothetical protein
MKKFIVFAISFIVLGFFTGCATSEFSHEDLIPEDTIFYAQITNPTLFLENTQSFLEESGLSGMLYGMDLKEFIQEVLESSLISIDGFDYSRTLGFAFRGNMVMDEFDAYILLPVLEESEDFQRDLEFTFGEDQVQRFPGYLVLSFFPGGLEEFPPKKTVNIEYLDTNYNAPGLEFYLNVQELAEAMGQDWADIVEEDLEEDNPFAADVIQVLEDLDGVYTSLQLDSNGASGEIDITFTGETAKRLRSENIKTIDLVSLEVPMLNDSVFSLVSVFDKSSIAEILDMYRDWDYEDEQFPEIDIQGLIDILEQLYSKELLDEVADTIAVSFYMDSFAEGNLDFNTILAIQSRNPEKLEKNIVEDINTALENFIAYFEENASIEEFSEYGLEVFIEPFETDFGYRYDIVFQTEAGEELGELPIDIGIFSYIKKDYLVLEITYRSTSMHDEIEMISMADIVSKESLSKLPERVSSFFSLDLGPIIPLVKIYVPELPLFFDDTGSNKLHGYSASLKDSVKFGMIAEMELIRNIIAAGMMLSDF